MPVLEEAESNENRRTMCASKLQRKLDATCFEDGTCVSCSGMFVFAKLEAIMHLYSKIVLF